MKDKSKNTNKKNINKDEHINSTIDTHNKSRNITNATFNETLKKEQTHTIQQ